VNDKKSLPTSSNPSFRIPVGRSPPQEHRPKKTLGPPSPSQRRKTFKPIERHQYGSFSREGQTHRSSKRGRGGSPLHHLRVKKAYYLQEGSTSKSRTQHAANLLRRRGRCLPVGRKKRKLPPGLGERKGTFRRVDRTLKSV